MGRLPSHCFKFHKFLVAILIVVLQCPSIHVSGFSSPSFTRPHLHAHNNHHVTSINNIPIIISSSRHGSSLYSTIDGDSSSVKTSNTDLSENVSSSNMSTSTSTSNFLQAVEYDWNGVINASVLLIVSLVVLSKFSLVDQGMMRGWTAAEMAVRIPVDNWNSYESVLHAAPVSTKAVTSATVYSIGDIIAQTTEGKNMNSMDRMRILRSLIAGLIGHGPLSHVWYDWSEEFFTNVMHLTDQWWAFFPKVAIDQLTWGPFWNNCYILLLGVMQFRDPKLIWKEIKETTVPLIVSGLKLWPLAHSITYGVIPVENRLLWVDLVEIIWVTILASAAAGASGHGSHGASVEDDTEVSSTEIK